MTTRTSGKRTSRSARAERFVPKTTTGRFVKSPAKAGSVSYRQVDKAVEKIASCRTSVTNSRSSHSSKTRD